MQGLLILAFDTSSVHCAAALLWAEGCETPPVRIETLVEVMERGQAERLVPVIDALMAVHQVGWPDFDAIVVGVGPGNFTGIRIAVSLARGLALGLGRPAIGVTAFEAVLPAPGPFWAVVEAPRGQVYAQRQGSAGKPVILDAGALPDLDAPVRSLTDQSADQTIRAIATVGLLRLAVPQPRPAPYYLRSADAAPSSDPGPVILP